MRLLVSTETSDASFPCFIATICERQFRLLDFVYAPSVGRFLNLLLLVSLLAIIGPENRIFLLGIGSR